MEPSCLTSALPTIRSRRPRRPPRPPCSPWARRPTSRVSQINNCAFCLQIHLNVSRKHGIAQEKLDLLATWQEAGIFSERECAALAWAEALTQLAGHSVSDAAYDSVRKHFSESEIVFLSTSIATINAWNRLGAAFRFAPPIPRTLAADKAA